MAFATRFLLDIEYRQLLLNSIRLVTGQSCNGCYQELLCLFYPVGKKRWPVTYHEITIVASAEPLFPGRSKAVALTVTVVPGVTAVVVV